MVIGEWWFEKDVEGRSSGLIYGIISTFDWRDWEKPRKTSVMVAVLRDEIWNWDLPSTKQVY
jgi:hypothetical protein